MKLFLSCALLLCTLAGNHAQAACDYKTLRVQGIDRTEIICAQSPGGPPRPVVLVFHGRGGSAQDMAEGIRLHELWPEALVVYLDGLPGIPAPYDKQGIGSGWQINPGDANDRDIAFVDATLDAVSQRYTIDSRRIFAVGHSNGASFLGVLWIKRAKYFAGFAFSASQAGKLIDSAKPLPIFMGMGMHDDLIPFETQRQSINYAAARLGIKSVQTENAGVNLYKGKDGIELMTFIHPGKHIWPIEQTKLIVDFFKRQIPDI